jgi:GNAT superfamily N-acetyltransferase
VIRSAKGADARPIAELQIRVWHRNWADFAQPVAIQTADIREARWDEWLKSLTVYVWDQDGTICGFVAIGPARDDDLGAEFGEFGVLMVDPPAQRNGIGSALHDKALDELREAGFAQVAHWVFVGNDEGERFLTDRRWAHDGKTGERHTLPERRFVRSLT